MNFPVIWTDIDLDAIGHNVRELRRITAPGAKFMAVVKANAYGHGSVPVALRALKEGADALGVARIQEGIELRQAGISAPILIFGPAVPEMVSDLLEQNLIV